MGLQVLLEHKKRLPCNRPALLDKRKMVPPARLELALPKEPDFESGASTNSTTGA